MLGSACKFSESPLLVSERISTFAGTSATPAAIVPHSSSRSTGCVNTVTVEKCDSTAHNVDRNVIEKPKGNLFESEERRRSIDAQRSISLRLKPQMLKLCGVLQLSV